MKVMKITGISLGGVVLVLYVSPYFFKEQINNGIKEVAKNYINTAVDFKDLDVSFFSSFSKTYRNTYRFFNQRFDAISDRKFNFSKRNCAWC